MELATAIAPSSVHEILSKHILADGMDLVLDMDKSKGVFLEDMRSGRTFLDFFGFFASNAIGMNHPGMTSDKDFTRRLMESAINKVTNSDVYTQHMARFVQTFSRVGIPVHLPYAFFVSGGALAIENALKTAFDWKVRKNFKKGYRRPVGQQVLHFEQAFHGRSGYTLSLTNTADPRKIQYFPKFDWPRVLNPKIHFPLDDQGMEDLIRREEMALAQIKRHFMEQGDDIACIIIEPIQGEGGDNHFRPSFLQSLKDVAHENDTLLVFDEVQSGVGITGHFWAHQGLSVEPDIIAFGKKTQVCGILAGPKLDEIDDHVFKVASRINSTWGGNLVDMVRFDRILEIIEADHLVENAAVSGKHLLAGLQGFAEQFDAFVSNPRGMGLMCAFDLPNTEIRNALLKEAYQAGLLLLGCGPHSIRFRPPLTITKQEIDQGLGMLEKLIRKHA